MKFNIFNAFNIQLQAGTILVTTENKFRSVVR